MTNRHHYLPKFYIKGFANSENKVYVYDKTENRLKKKEVSPKQIFFDWNRNTLDIDGEKTDFVEEIYAAFEDKIAPVYNRIKNQSGIIQYGIEDIFRLLLLVSLTYWRLPKNDQDIQNFISSLPNNKLLIEIFSKENGNKLVDKNLYDEMRNKVGFTEIYRLLKPSNDFILLNKHQNIKNWKVYGESRVTNLHLLGDDPIIFKNKPKNDNILETQLVFPLTNGITLYHYKGEVVKEIQPEYRLMIDIMVFLQSEKYVIGANKEYLDVVCRLAKEYSNKEKVEFLRSEIFRIFD